VFDYIRSQVLPGKILYSWDHVQLTDACQTAQLRQVIVHIRIQIHHHGPWAKSP